MVTVAALLPLHGSGTACHFKNHNHGRAGDHRYSWRLFFSVSERRDRTSQQLMTMSSAMVLFFRCPSSSSGGLHVRSQMWPWWRSPNVLIIHYVSGTYGSLYICEICVNLIWYLYAFLFNSLCLCLSLCGRALMTIKRYQPCVLIHLQVESWIMSNTIPWCVRMVWLASNMQVNYE